MTESDDELLRRWREDDRAAGEQLFGRHFDSVCRFFRSKLGDDVEDLIQTVFTELTARRDHMAATGFRAYLFGICRNVLFDHLRRRYRTPTTTDLSEISIAQIGTTPSQQVARNDNDRLLRAALPHLSLDHQIAIELAYWEELSGPEIADVLGVPANTIRGRLARARVALRDQMLALQATPTQIAESEQALASVLAD